MFANTDARLSILGERFLAADEHSLCLPAASAAGWLSGTVFFILGRFWDSEQSQANHRSRQFSSNHMWICLFVFGINSEAIYWKNNTLEVLVHLKVCHLVFAPPLLFYTRSLDFFCQAAGQKRNLVQQLGASLLFWCRQLPVMKMVQWEPALKSQGRWCGNGVEIARDLNIHTLGMGCTTSVILFKGIRTVFERNCAYMCKQQGETNALEYTAYNWTKEDSELLISSCLVNAVS